MELTVDPEALRIAAAALNECVWRLSDDVDAFGRAATRDVPDLGREAVAAAGLASDRARHATTTIADDLGQLASALRRLADFYAATDRAMVVEAQPLRRPSS